MSLEDYLVWKCWYVKRFRKNIFYFYNVLISGFVIKIFNMRYEGNLLKDYNLFKSYFVWKVIFCFFLIDSICGWYFIV